MSSLNTSTPRKTCDPPGRDLKDEAVKLMDRMLHVAAKNNPDTFVEAETLKAVVKDLTPVVLTESVAMNCVGIIYKKKPGQSNILLKTEVSSSAFNSSRNK